MASKASNLDKPARKKAESKYAGRSAVTGLMVFKPTTKQGRISLEEARAAWRRVLDAKQVG